ncbi:MAG: helix-turn-helix domain-containing protein [Longimicrobiales bacterium]
MSVRGTETVLHLEVAHRFTEDVLGDIERLPPRKRERVVLVIPSLSPRRRAELRHQDISWIEYRTGAVHLRVPHLAIDLPEAPSTEADRPTPLPRLSGKAGGVVEALIELGHQRALVTQAEIAELSGSTRAWTSRLFSQLVKAGALEEVGRRGMTKEWHPKLDELLRLWIADEGPSPTVRGLYLWSRTSSDLLKAVGELGADGADYAIGGVAAADLHEPTLTGLPDVAAWIPMATPPEAVAARLRAEFVDSGANLFLWQSPGDAALRMAGPLAHWRGDAPEARRKLRVVTPARAVVEASRASGRGPEVAESLRRRILERTRRSADEE